MKHINLGESLTLLYLRRYPCIQTHGSVSPSATIVAEFVSIGDTYTFNATLQRATSDTWGINDNPPTAPFRFDTAVETTARVGMYWMKLRIPAGITLADPMPFHVYDDDYVDVLQVHVHNNDEVFTVTTTPDTYTSPLTTTFYNG